MSAHKLPPPHPGEILLEEYLKPFGLSQNKLGRDLGIPAQRVNAIVRGPARHYGRHRPASGKIF